MNQKEYPLINKYNIEDKEYITLIGTYWYINRNYTNIRYINSVEKLKDTCLDQPLELMICFYYEKKGFSPTIIDIVEASKLNKIIDKLNQKIRLENSLVFHDKNIDKKISKI
jgi:hypothetical protein